MSRKHDKSVDDEQSPNLLLTGPIAIRGLGRGVKDALVRGQPSRHRAFATGGTEHEVHPTPLQQMLAGGPEVAEAGPSSHIAAHADAQRADMEEPMSLSSPSRAEAGDDPQEVPVDGRAGKDASEDEAALPTGAPASAEVAVDDWASAGDGAAAHEAEVMQTDPVNDDRAVVTTPEPESFGAEPFDEFDALPADGAADERPIESDTSNEAEPLVDGSSDDLPAEQAGAGAEELSPMPEAASEFPADEEADAAEPEPEPVSEPEAASQPAEPTSDETVEPADAEPDSALDVDQPTPEDRIELLEAARPEVQWNPAGEQVATPGESESEPGSANEDGAEDLSVPTSDAVGEAGAASEHEDPELEEPEGTAVALDEPEVASSEQPEVDDAPDPQPEADHQVGDEEAEHSAGEDIVAVAASELPADDTAQQRKNDAEVTSYDGPGDSATAGTADEHEQRDETATLPEAQPLLVEPAIDALPSEPGDEVAATDAAAEDQQAEQGQETEQPTPSEDPGGRAPTDEASDGRQWVTAEELFGLPLQPGRQDDPVVDAERLGEGSPAAGEHLGEPEPAGEAPAEDAPMPEAVAAEPEPVEHEPVPQPGAVAAEPVAAEPEHVAAEPEPEPEPTAEPVAAEPQPQPQPEPEPEPVAVAAEPAPSPAPLARESLGAGVPVALAAARSEPGRSRPTAPSLPPRGPRPMRERFRREAIGIAVLVVLALICAGLITAVVIKTRHDAAIAASEAAHYTPPPLATPQSTKTGPVVAVIGDASATSTAPGVTAKQQWSSVLATSLGGTVSTDSSDGMGYAVKGTSGTTFVQEAGKVPSDAKVVVFFGGAADSNIAPLSLAKAATDAFAAAKQQAPGAKILVVGPAVKSGVSSANLAAIRNTLRGAAAVVKATWVDPLDRGWLSAAKQAATPAALSASDQSTLASKMQAAVKTALG